MKKLFSLLLALAILSGLSSGFAEAAAAGPVPLPAVGDVVEGFEVLEIRPFDMIGAKLVLFEHRKTGAKLTYIANEDTNRVFQLTFPTRPVDNTGLPHVFEHSTLSGSEKYPSTSLFMNVNYQTYNTYMNAYTTDAMTCYPVASLSEKQLLALADLYTDCCLHPLIMEREDIYRTEAWRYEMADLDSPLTLNGTVYSEMTGAMTIGRAALDNANEATFPGASLSFDYGGKPEAIQDMTWEALKEYHNMYYHPSNCMAYLYGSFDDYTAFLKLLDTAFSGYERQEAGPGETGYVRITEPVVTAVPYPVAEGTDPSNQTCIYYYVLCPGLREDKAAESVLDHALTLLSTDGSVLIQNLKKALPSGSFSAGREIAAPDDAVVFVAQNVSPEDAETFRTVVNDSLKQVVQDGFDPVQLDTVLTSQQLANKLMPESDDPVEGIIYKIAYSYAVTGDPFDFAVQMEDMNKLREENDNGLLVTSLSSWLVDPSLWTLTSTFPEPGLKEKQDDALAASLAEIKTAMSDEEKQAVVAATAAQPEEEDNAEMLAAVKVVSVSDLPEEVRKYAVTDVTGEDGVRRLNAAAGVDGVGKVSLYLDARALPQEDLHYLRLFTRLMGKLDTDAHPKEELAGLTDRYLSSMVIGVDVFNTPDKDDVRSLLVAQWIALDGDLAAGYDLVSELLFHTQFTDLQVLSDQIAAQKAYVRNNMNQDPYAALLLRQIGVGDPSCRYYDYINYTAYYTFLEDLEKQMKADPESVAARLRNVQSFLANRTGAVATYAGSEASIAVNASLADAFFAGLPAETREYPVYDLPAPQMREGIAVDGGIQFNVIAASFSQIGADLDYALGVIGPMLADKLLLPVLRDRMGAYGVICNVYEDIGMYIISYRDPNVKETFDVFDAIPSDLGELELSQADVDGYIISAYSGLAKPKGELTGADNALEAVLHEKPADETLQMMRAYKSVTPESVRAAAGTFSLLLENGPRGTVGSIGALEQNSGLYDTVMNPFNAEDMSQKDFTDVAEDSEYLEAVRFVVANGLMQPKDDSLFGPDDPATMGDLLGGMYVLVGGPSADAEAGRELLAQYNLVSAEQDLEAVLTESLLCSVINGAFGPVLSTDTPDTPVPRADLADLFMQIMQAQ